MNLPAQVDSPLNDWIERNGLVDSVDDLSGDQESAAARAGSGKGKKSKSAA